MDEFDFIIIGTGLSGLISAYFLKDYGRVLLISKKKMNECATSLAQGGIASVSLPTDSFESHVKDTMVAGAFHNDKKAVEFLVQQGPAAIALLEDLGVPFDKGPGGFLLGREAAHSSFRIIHATDFTGKVIEDVITEKIRAYSNITIWEDSFVLDLIVDNNRCFGIKVLRNDAILYCFSKATVLATGGLGQLYQKTTNPTVATGDGIAIAKRAGAIIEDLEFIQFHPTALKDSDSPLFLLSEALRGEGAYILDYQGKRFMKEISPLAELAPRDQVAREIFKKQKEGEVYLDIRHKGKEFLLSRFPNIYAQAKEKGCDLANEVIPITPAAHYSCGGIRVNLYGQTSIQNLLAFGEVSRSGVHGANRLASNSLLEAIVFPMQIPHILSQFPIRIEKKKVHQVKRVHGHPKSVKLDRKALQTLMWENVGIIRKEKELEHTRQVLSQWSTKINHDVFESVEYAEFANMLLVASGIVQASLQRKKSLGSHFRLD